MKNLAKMYYVLPAIGLVSLTTVSLVALLMASASAANSTTSSASASVTVASACTMSSTVNTTHNATITNGTYKEDIGKTTLKVICNDNSGFSIHAVGYSNDTFGNNKLVANVGGILSPTNDIITGTAIAGNISNWSMKLTSIAGTYAPTLENGYESYKEVPATYTKVATFNSTTDATIGSSIETTYRAYISGTQPAGTYTGKVKYTMVHPATAEPNQPKDCTANKICYWPNGDGEVVDSMGGQNISSTATNAELWATNFRRDGYGFAGWSDKFDWVLNENDVNGNGTGPNAGYHIYGPNATITTPANMTEKGLSLYAVWVKSNGNLQGWNYCSALSTGKVTALTDQRDGNTYAVAKLKDNKCWMIENLRLDNTNSDNATGALAQGYGTSTTYGNFSGLAEPETANFTNSTIANSLYYSGTQSGTASVNIGTNNYPGYRMPRFNNQNTTSSATNMTGTRNNTYSYGNWYTWPAAIADTSYYGTNNQTITGTSICPKGWHLPSGGNSNNATNSDFWKLGTGIMGFAPSNNSYYQNSETNTDSKTATQAFRSYPNNFIYSGNFYDSSAGNRGAYGDYWSSTVGNSYSSYYLSLGSSYVYPGVFYINKYNSRSIRCVQ